MYLGELRKIRDKAAAFVADIDDTLCRFQPDEVSGFLELVERKDDNLCAILRNATIDMGKSALRIEADAIHFGFLTLFRSTIRDMFKEYTGRSSIKIELLKR